MIEHRWSQVEKGEKAKQHKDEKGGKGGGGREKQGDIQGYKAWRGGWGGGSN